MGGASHSEGTVMVCRVSLWGLVAEDGWSQTDAQVVCTQLGFPLEGAYSVYIRCMHLLKAFQSVM